jgi:hypothetical protein
MAEMYPPWEQSWERCSLDGCTGVRLSSVAWCLTHAAEHAPDAFDAELKRIGVEGTVDARGVVISAELLTRLLKAVPRKDNRPTFTAARFDRASFQAGAEFYRVSFQDQTWFNGASFHRSAGFDGTSQDTAWLQGASFQDRAFFREVSYSLVGGALAEAVKATGPSYLVRGAARVHAAWSESPSLPALPWPRARCSCSRPWTKMYPPAPLR